MEPARTSAHDLLDDYLALSLSLPQLAKRHNLSLRALIDFLDNPETQRTLADLRRHAARRARDASIHARAAAIDTLILHATADPTSESARRAATELLRDRVRTRRPIRRRAAPATAPAETATNLQRRLRRELRAVLRLARSQQRKRRLGISLCSEDRDRARTALRRLSRTQPLHRVPVAQRARDAPSPESRVA